MGKAYTNEEREAIKTTLMESAIELFHENDNGAKSLSIRELTKRAGISQGGFYNFWEDKDALILDVIKYRARQKLDLIVPLFPKSLKNPRDFLSRHLYDWCIDMNEKIRNKPLYANSLLLLRRNSLNETDRMSTVYRDFLTDLSDYWLRHHAVKKVDVDGLISLFSACGVLLTNHVQMDETYFSELLKVLIDGAAEKYIVI